MPEINFEPIEYDSLSKKKKLAALCIALGSETTSELLKFFNDLDTEEICREIMEMKSIDNDVKRQVLEEFSEIISQSMGTLLGGSVFAQKALQEARGESKANNMLSKIAPVTSSSEVIAELGEMEPRRIFNLIRNEHPQTIAFLVSHLTTHNAAKVVAMLPGKLREDVMELVGGLDGSSTDMVGKVVMTLKRHIDDEDQTTIHKSGGVSLVADLLNLMDKDISKNLLDKIEENNPNLGAAIRKKMFGFDDLVKLGIPDLQRIAREVDMQDLTVALKSAAPALQDALFQSVSKRAAETLKEEIEMLGPMKLKDVEAAQDRIIQTVRKLEEEGEISSGDDGDMV